MVLATGTVLGIGLLVTVVLSLVLAREARKRDLARFDQFVHDAREMLETRVENYEAKLAGVQEFFSSRQVVRQTEWDLRIDRDFLCQCQTPRSARC